MRKRRISHRCPTGYAPPLDSTLLTSASLHDSQAAIPLATLSAERTTNLYDLMDAAYDAEPIRQHSRSLGHVPLIDTNPAATRRWRRNCEPKPGACSVSVFSFPSSSLQPSVRRVSASMADSRTSSAVATSGSVRLESDVSPHVRRARTHRRPARTPGDITSAPPATPLGARWASVTRRCPQLGRELVETSYLHLSACRRSSRARIQSAIQGKWVFSRRIEDCAKPQAPGVSQAARTSVVPTTWRKAVPAGLEINAPSAP